MTFNHGVYIACLLTALGVSSLGQTTAKFDSIQVYYDQPQGEFPRVWNFFGYDEPNYTYAPNGKKLLGEIAALSPTPAYIRVHNLLTTGDGSASLKWGSTNAYTEDASGNTVYSWTVVDRIFDTFHDAGLKPLVEIGFMPEALSTHPEPYRHTFPQGSIFTGWAYPPKDYDRWSKLIYQFVRHLRERYGDAEVKTWLWEVWNEPDIEYWKGTPEEFFKLYDYTVDAVLRALPSARIGGPDSTGPANEHAAEFLKSFLEHCAHQKNFATGKPGTRVDFISFHPKGAPTWKGDHVQMGLARELASIQKGFEIVASFKEYKNTPVILGEWDPEGCAACSAKKNPQNAYRNGPLYATYTVEALNATLALAARSHTNLIGAVSWSFEFEDQPYFEGYRELATNGIDKPVFNAFRMLGLLGQQRIATRSSGELPLDDVLRDGVRNTADIRGLASRSDHSADVLVWNYHDDETAGPNVEIELTINGLPSQLSHVKLEQFRIDAVHSNAYARWLKMNSPQSPSPDQYKELESAGQLQTLGSPIWVSATEAKVYLRLSLPREAISLVRLSW
jgi:xylan 1,4-beta-xylosidase